MSLVLEEIVEKAKNIPVRLDGEEKRLEDLNNTGVYDTIIRNYDTGDRIYLGEKTRQGIAIHLFHMGISDRLTLCNFGYTILAKTPERREAK